MRIASHVKSFFLPEKISHATFTKNAWVPSNLQYDLPKKGLQRWVKWSIVIKTFFVDFHKYTVVLWNNFLHMQMNTWQMSGRQRIS